MRIAVRTATDVGLRRTQNEDSHGTWVPEGEDERGRRGVLLVVADGMGGSQAGEVASRIAVQSVLRTYRDAPGPDPLDNLIQAVAAANAAVHRESTGRPELAGMGTTCTTVLLRDHELYWAHVGDSRAYLIRGGRIRQITHDHSLVAQMVRDGQLTAEQAKADPRRNVVTRSVGVGPNVEIDAERSDLALEPGDTLLLCSDGLHGLVDDAELAEIAAGPDLDGACADAIALANERGGPDNITVVMARVLGPGDATAPEGPPADVERTAERRPPSRRANDLRHSAVAAAGAEGATRARTGTLVLWLVLAVTVLLIAVLAMAFVWQRLDAQKRELERHGERISEAMPA